jgi:hypothetical protein
LNKRTVARQQLASTAAEQGITPLEVMLKRMRYYDSIADRELEKGEAADPCIIDSALKAANEAAKDAAPYVHARLSAVEHRGGGVSIFAQWRDEFAASVRGLPDPAKIPPDRDERVIDVTPTQETPQSQTPSPAPSPAGPSPSGPESPPWMKSILLEPPSYDWVAQRRR